MSASFRRTGSRIVHEGVLVNVRVDDIVYEDGATAEREVVEHPGAVGIVAVDGDSVVLVRQPREPVGEEGLLEIPAGKLDVPGEPPEECARRELAEECGLAASSWEELKRVYTSPGFTDERLIIYLARDLRPAGDGGGVKGEKIEIVRWPLDDLDGAIAAVADAGSLVGLLLLRARLR